MIRTAFFEEGDWSEFIEQYRILRPKDKVKQNTNDDYGLGRGWYFCTGSHVINEKGKLEWVVIYVRLVPSVAERVKNHCCDAAIGSTQLIVVDDNACLLYRDRAMIASGIICQRLTGIPQPIKDLFIQEPADEKG